MPIDEADELRLSSAPPELGSYSLWSEKGAGEKVQLLEIPDDLEEAQYVIEAIQAAHCHGGAKWRDFAVRVNLVSTHFVTLRDLQKALSQEPGGIEALVHCQLGQIRSAQTRSGKPYYRLRLNDAQDGIDLNAWNDTAAYAAVENKLVSEADFIELRGVFSKNDRGLNVQDIALRQLTDEEKTTLLNGPTERSADLDKWEAELVEAIEAMEDPLLKTLSTKIFSKTRVRFKRAAAAFKVHHARRRGLLEHTASMVRLAKALGQCYPDANLDLIVFGTLFHDLGKTHQCDVEEGFAAQASLTGELIGHIAVGALIVSTALLETTQADKTLLAGRSFEEVRAHILHVILAHHGTNEHGSPVEPQTLEALIVHSIDTLDAHAEIMRNAWLAVEPTANLIDAPRPLKGKLARSLKGTSVGRQTEIQSA
jgi:3'-5' exoribonuclease